MKSAIDPGANRAITGKNGHLRTPFVGPSKTLSFRKLVTPYGHKAILQSSTNRFQFTHANYTDIWR
jgi:hypothetical protein